MQIIDIFFRDYIIIMFQIFDSYFAEIACNIYS